MNKLHTPGPQRGPFVIQHISVLHTEHFSQSQPHFFSRIKSHLGQRSAFPLLIISYLFKKQKSYKELTKLFSS